ncbi:MAG TPA: type II toxin-antitoxin system HicB family antitoxin [Actinomycetota bacterium]|nr:type II toxin-antitoxin system HicB family antitoxin [Actinomycetota bacterium]
MINENDYKPEVLELLHQPWTIEIRPYSDGGFFARVVELRGCMTEADTQLEALQQLEEAQAEWLAAALEAGDPIPRPSGDNEFSGKIFVRTSPHLHRMVSEAALREGVSMSQWVSEVLSRAVAFREMPPSWEGSALGDYRSMLEQFRVTTERVTKALAALRVQIPASGVGEVRSTDEIPQEGEASSASRSTR